MKKSLITLSVTIIVLVIAYLAYDLTKKLKSPCESIFQQTSLRLGSKLEIIKSKGEVLIGEEKIQDLTERSQMMALNLKTCCIVLEGGKMNSEEFLRCKDSAEKYETQIEKIANNINEAQVAKQEGETELVNEKVSQINQNINVAKTSSEEFRKQVTELQAPQPTEKEESSKIGGAGVLEFKWSGDDCWGIYRGDKRITGYCGTGKQALQEGTYTIKPNIPVFEPFNVTIEKGRTTTVTP